MTMAHRAPRLPIAGLLAGLLAGCGYTFGSGLHRSGIRTVAFQVVGNDTYRQRLEAEISHYLARELPATTDLRLADRASADATLQVVLEKATEGTLVIGLPSGQSDSLDFGDPNYSRVREGGFQGTILMRLIARDGTVRIERRITDTTEFRSPIGETLTTAKNEFSEDIARKIALALEDEF